MKYTKNLESAFEDFQKYSLTLNPAHLEREAYNTIKLISRKLLHKRYGWLPQHVAEEISHDAAADLISRIIRERGDFAPDNILHINYPTKKVASQHFKDTFKNQRHQQIIEAISLKHLTREMKDERIFEDESDQIPSGEVSPETFSIMSSEIRSLTDMIRSKLAHCPATSRNCDLYVWPIIYCGATNRLDILDVLPFGRVRGFLRLLAFEVRLVLYRLLSK